MDNQEMIESQDTRIGKAILITGRLEGDGNVIVEGRVEGNISIKGDLQVEVSGQVKSTVQARNIYVMGILVGDAVATEKIELAPGGRMVGDVRTPRMLINEGAAYRGNVDMVDFEGEDRAGEVRRAASRPVSAQRTATPAPRAATPTTPSPAARTPQPEPRRESPPPVRPAATAPARPATPGLYTPPPLPRPPDLLGNKKAIVIRKKSNESG